MVIFKTKEYQKKRLNCPFDKQKKKNGYLLKNQEKIYK